MNTKLSNITTQYRQFNDNQALTENQLNEFLDYFEDQDRLSRTQLSGTGIVCGFKTSIFQQKVATGPKSTGIRTFFKINQGVGVTTDGDLISLEKTIEDSKDISINFESKEYTHYRKYIDVANYSNFSPLGKQVPLLEIRNEKDILEGEINEFKPLDFEEIQQKIVVLYLESYEEELACDAVNCDEQGIKQVKNLRVLLMSPTDAERVIASRPQDTIYTKYNKYEEVYNNLPNIEVARTILTSDIQTEEELNLKFNEAIAKDGIINKLDIGFKAVSSLFGVDLSFGGGTLLSKLIALSNVTSTKNFQYRYDLLKDLVATYNEIKELLLYLKSECCPNIDSYRKHLLLGVAGASLELGDETPFRHDFYKSPIITNEDENYKKVVLLANRFVQLVNNFQAFNGAIKITPSRYSADLGEKAIPFYYDVNTSLLKKWSFDKTQNEKENYNLSYHKTNLSSAAFIQNPLDYNIENSDFYRIEGHLGLPYEMAYKNIDAIKNDYGLAFNIKTVFLKETASVSEGNTTKPISVKELREQLFKITNTISKGKVDLKEAYKTISSLDNNLESISRHPNWVPKDPKEFLEIGTGTSGSTSGEVVTTPIGTEGSTGSGTSTSGEVVTTPKEDKIESILLSDFMELHSGMEHYAGVQPGGTFVMVYESEDNDQVLADFALPYVCCAKEDPILLTLPATKLCGNDAPIAIALAPLDGIIKTFVSGKEISAIVKQGTQNLFDPSKVAFATGVVNNTVTFTVNDEPVETTIEVFKQTGISVSIANVVYTEGTATVDFAVTALNGGSLNDIDIFHWKFGNGKEIRKAPVGGIYTYPYTLVEGQEVTYTPELIVTNKNGCNTSVTIEPVSLKLTINKDTKIQIYFDASGSMRSTETPLEYMRDTLLKTELLPLYGGDLAAYNKNVKVTRFTDERTFKTLNLNGETPEGNVITLVFQDEANSTYHNSSSISNRTTNFNNDIRTFRTRLANNFGTGNPNYYRGIVFQVDANGNNLTFHNLMKAVENGTGSYAGVNGLDGTPYEEKMKFVYNVTDGGTASYYMGLVKQALIDLGYSL